LLNAGERYMGNEATDAGRASRIGVYHAYGVVACHKAKRGALVITYRLDTDSITSEKYRLMSFGFILS
jgi:hypothetical protein